MRSPPSVRSRPKCLMRPTVRIPPRHWRSWRSSSPCSVCWSGWRRSCSRGAGQLVNRLLRAPGQWGAGWRIGAALLCLFVLAAPPERASAHAFLERSEPGANDVLPEAPAEILMWFTEPLEPSYTGAQLFDVRGEPGDTPDAVVDPDDPYHLRLPLPGDLAPGTYTVAWRNISTADGHPAEGFFAFTIGSDADIAVPVAPATTDFGGQPTWVE